MTPNLEDRPERGPLRGAGRRAAAGALDGLAATAAMSGAMYGAKRAGWLGKPPPETITERALRAVGARRVSRDTTAGLALLAHFAFGAASGALYAAPRRRSRSMGRAAVEGAAFGALVWTVSYAGWIPALGILPSPPNDREGRPASMFASHLLFGAALGVLGARRRQR